MMGGLKKFLAAVGLLFLFALSGPALAGRELPDFTELVEKQGAAVVNISIVARPGRNRPFSPDMDEDDPMFDFFHRFFPRPPGSAPHERDNRAMGSGFIVSSDGYILTNAHVLEGADEILVRLTDKREFRGRLIGMDARTDVAVVKIEAENLPRVTLGDPARLKVGEWVIAIGSPFGFENSVTAGIVSAKGRELPQENLVPFIQTDVAINPGNSGGPLFNMKGQVVGINSQIYSRSGGYMGLSFAIPIDVAMEVHKQLRAGGRVSRGRIGVAIQEVSRELAESFGLAKPMGALVASVERGSPADKAGILAGDIILMFDGKAVETSASLPRIVTATRPGARVPVQVWRKGGSRELRVAVAEMPEDRPARDGRSPAPRPEAAGNRLGLLLADMSASRQKELGVAGGVLVEEVQGAAARGELRRGDILLAIISRGASIELRSVDQFNRFAAGLGKGATLTLLVRRGDSQTFVTLRVPGEK